MSPSLSIIFPAKDAPKCPPSKCAADLFAKAMARSGEAGEAHTAASVYSRSASRSLARLNIVLPATRYLELFVSHFCNT